ncbi:MAG TPA: methionine--tRNA ligase [bacterium]|nr:methionine--tRNA ligase [bacterium]
MKFYVTTPLYYVNDKPHIGHTYTTVAADALARFHRLSGNSVFFLTGTDEHGQKIFEAAKKQDMTPKELADINSGVFKKLWEDLDISYSRFIRTTEPGHEEVVKKIFAKLLENGDLYRGEYRGYYCTPCEAYVQPDAENAGICPDCKRKVSEISEPSYFLNIARYKDRLEKHIGENSFVKPDFRKNEVLNMLKSGMPDVSVTRKNVDWGIPSPTPEGYNIYVWIDALLNYLSGIGYLSDEKLFEEFWPADVQLIGKDIIKFHDIIWPGILLALGLPLPKTIFAHGWWTLGKDKISKSKGNAISPRALMDEYGADPFRFFLLREVPFGLDGEYSDENFKKRYNSDLVNDFGNLVNRTLNLVETKTAGIIPDGSPSDELVRMSGDVYAGYRKKMEAVAFSEAIEEAWKLVVYLNKYLDTSAPWKEECREREQILYNTMHGIRNVLLLISPFIPSSAAAMWKMLGFPKSPEEEGFSLLEKKLQGGIRTNKREILFARKK